MRSRLIIVMFVFGCGITQAANYETPIISDLSPYYYVPQTPLEKRTRASFPLYPTQIVVDMLKVGRFSTGVADVNGKTLF